LQLAAYAAALYIFAQRLYNVELWASAHAQQELFIYLVVHVTYFLLMLVRFAKDQVLEASFQQLCLSPSDC
jgi:hypothetical protein